MAIETGKRYEVLSSPVFVSVRKGGDGLATEWLMPVKMKGPFDYMRVGNNVLITSSLDSFALPVWDGDDDHETIRVSLNGKDIPA